MKNVEIYTKSTCGYCHAAKRLLTSKGVRFSDISLSQKPDMLSEMVERSNGGRTVPQIFIGDTHVGGCDELFALDKAGKLDSLLAA